MSSFKHRPPKLKYRSDAITLDEIHKNQMEAMNSNYKKLEYLSKTSDLLIGYYDKTSKEYYNHDCGEEDIIEISDCNARKTSTSEFISDKELCNEDEQIFNLSNNLKLLNQLSKNSRKEKKPVKKRKKNSNTAVKSIFNFFDEEAEKNNDCEKESDKVENVKDTNYISTLGKNELQDKFLFIMDKNYACTKIKARKSILCSICGIEKTLFTTDGCYTCKKCGETEHIVMENENSGNKDTNFEKQKYPYKKINHLKEKLNQFQSKENADIPESLYNLIFDELKKQRINPQSTTPFEIKTILKKNRQTNYYEHLQQIYCKITGNLPITLPRDIETKIINMFQSIQESFQKHKLDNRSNFLSYAYVLNKLFLILGFPYHAAFFCLLKSKDKLRDQDKTWCKICNDKGWKFYPSISSNFSNICINNDDNTDNLSDEDIDYESD